MNGSAEANAVGESPAPGRFDGGPSKTRFYSRRDIWVQHYVDRMMERMRKWDLGLGIAAEYAGYLQKELTGLYDEPLMRTFVEANY